MKQVTENVFVEIEYQGCNPGFVVTRDGIVMIDTPQFPTDALAYKEIIDKKGPIRYLINTEPHGDHYMGNFFFETICIAHQGTRDAIEKASLDQIKERLKMIDPSYSDKVDSYRIRVPTVTFTDSMKIYAGDHEFQLLHLPGHTASETAVYIPRERVVFTGDNIFHNVQTFLHEAVPLQWLESLETLKTLDVDYYIPGHGDVCQRPYLDKQAEFIKEWISAVKDGVNKGWSLEEAQEKISFLDRYPIEGAMKAFGRELQKMNVARLYSLAKDNQI
jgi:cyclase